VVQVARSARWDGLKPALNQTLDNSDFIFLFGNAYTRNDARLLESF
jgi:hypothetical protein